jgi:hypothetical protein
MALGVAVGILHVVFLPIPEKEKGTAPANRRAETDRRTGVHWFFSPLTL